MEAHFELSDEAFEKQFRNCEMDPAIFSHEAHLRLAWIHVRKYGVDKAVDHICEQLLTYVTFLGAKDKYNKTLTIAAVRAVSHFIQKSESQDFQTFINEFPRLKTNFKDLMGFHYSTDIFKSEEAREIFLEPDLAPFD